MEIIEGDFTISTRELRSVCVCYQHALVLIIPLEWPLLAKK